MKRLVLPMLLVLVVIAGLAKGWAAEAGWRGDGSGRALAAEPCFEWGGTGQKNILWKTRVGVNCKTGKILWEHTNNFADLSNTKKPENRNATSCGFTTPTPTTDGKRVYAVFGTGIVVCYDFDGHRQWIRYMATPQTLEYGRSASPVIVADRLVCLIGNLIAFDTVKGTTAWELPDVTETYGTPIVAKLGDMPVIITPNGTVVRVTDGKILARGIGEATHTSPIVQDGVVFFVDAHCSAVKLTLKPDGKLETRELWQVDLEGEFFASPVWHEGFLYCINNSGALQVLDAATGKTIYQQTLDDMTGGNFYASLAIAGGKLFIANDKGVTLLVTLGREFKSVKRNTLDNGAGSTPIFDGRMLFLRAGEFLCAIGAP